MDCPTPVNVLVITAVLFFFAGRAFASDMDWRQCVLTAVVNNRTLSMEREKLEQDAGIKIGDRSALLPNIAFQSDSSYNRTQGSVLENPTLVNSSSAQLTASQLIFDGLQTVNKVRSASEDINSEEFNYYNVSSQVRLSLRQAYVGLFIAQEQIKINKEIYERRRQNLELTRLRYEGGWENSGSLAQATVDLKAAALNVIQAERNLDLARYQLLLEMGSGDFEPLKIKEDLTLKVSQASTAAPDFDRIARSSPIWSAVVATTSARFYDFKSAQGGYFPTVTFNAGAGEIAASYPPPHQYNYSVGLKVSMPIFDGGFIKSNVMQSKALFEQAQSTQATQDLNTLYQLRSSWIAWQNAIENVDLARSVLKATQERSDITAALYSAGYVSFDDWAVIEDLFVQNKNNYLTAIAQALLTQAQWVQSQGGTLEDEK